MSNLTLDDNQAAFQIRSYLPGRIQINDRVLTRSVIIMQDRLIEDWKPQTADEITLESLSLIRELKPAILLIGTGSAHLFLPIEIYGELLNDGIGVEMMETGAASRTYNALTAESRSVIAALIL